MKKNNKYGFTLVELLAVIVILAIILVIAVPQIMNTIDESRNGALMSSAKLIAASAETKKIANDTLEITEEITCDMVSELNKDDYESCTIEFDENNKALVTIVGKGKFAGKSVCNATRSDASVSNEGCTPVVNAENFTDDDWSTIVAAVKSGTYPYEVGDTKTVDLGSLGTHTLRVANTTSCSEEWKSDVTKSQTACGFVLEFADVIENAVMNVTSTNAGGWPASEMRAYLNDLDEEDTTDGVIYNALPEELRNGIIDTYVISSHGLSDTGTIGENNNFASTDKLYLLSTEEVWAQGDSNTIDYDTSRGTSRQLDYYANYEGETGVSTSNYAGTIKQNAEFYSWWWLRSANSGDSGSFYIVRSGGDWANDLSFFSGGVAPAFRLAE